MRSLRFSIQSYLSVIFAVVAAVTFIFLLASSAFAQTLSQEAPAQPSPQSASPIEGVKLKQITFDDAFARIIERDLEIRSQQLSVNAAESRRLRAYGQFTPSISFEASETRGGDPVVDPRKSAVAKATVNLFRSGGDVAGVRAARREVKAEEESLVDTRHDAEERAVQVILDVMTSERRVSINKKIVELRNELHRIARERYAQGLLPRQEVDKVLVELENARARLIDAETDQSVALANLEARLGEARTVLNEWPWREVISKSRDVESINFKIDLRPDYRSSLLSLESQRLQRYQALSALLPSVDFTASHGNYDLSQSGRRDWSAMLTLSVPIFEGFKSWSAYQLQGVELQRAEIAREAIQRLAPAEVASLKRTFKAARESALARERTSRLTEQLFTDSTRRFRLGRSSVNDLAVDQNRLLESQLLEVDGWANAHLSYARLCHALGSSVSAQGECKQ